MEKYAEYTLVSGGKEWGCKDDNGVVAPFYRFVWYNKPYTKDACAQKPGQL
jgi:hypothetical protein